MACLKVDGPWGEYLLPEGPDGNVRGMRPGERIIGVAWDCGPQSSPAGEAAGVKEALEKEGIPWGSAIAWVTKKIGMKQCSSCKAREVILNHAGKNGWTETFRQIRDTL